MNPKRDNIEEAKTDIINKHTDRDELTEVDLVLIENQELKAQLAAAQLEICRLQSAVSGRFDIFTANIMSSYYAMLYPIVDIIGFLKQFYAKISALMMVCENKAVSVYRHTCINV